MRCLPPRTSWKPSFPLDIAFQLVMIRRHEGAEEPNGGGSRLRPLLRRVLRHRPARAAPRRRGRFRHAGLAADGHRARHSMALWLPPLAGRVRGGPLRQPRRRRAALGLLVFGKVFGGSISLSRHPYILFPLLAWAALRFGHYGAVTSVFLVCGIAVTGTAMGFGPFARPVLADSLLDLQAFMGVAAGTALVLGAAIAERNRAVAARDEFLSTASHELRTPFTALSLQVQGLIRRLRRSEAIPSREEMLVDLESANRLLARAARMIDELLEISRVAAGPVGPPRGDRESTRLKSHPNP